MSQLSETINKAVELAMSSDGFDATELAPQVWDDLDGDSQKICGIGDVTRRLKDAANKFAKREAKALASAQMDLPFKNLPGVVALDLEGRKIKPTLSLKQIEFERARAIRKKQLEDDKRILDDFDAFEVAARPHWLKHPDWNVGQVIDAIMGKSKNSKTKPTVQPSAAA